MKNYQIRIQPFSALAGACLVVLCLVATGAFAPQGASPVRDRHQIQIYNGEFMHISCNGTETTYTVPQGKAFIVSYLYRANCGAGTSGIHFRDASGAPWYSWSAYNETSAVQFDQNIVVNAGEQISAFSTCGSTTTFAAGYLVDA
jgi:hypothetical protein